MRFQSSLFLLVLMFVAPFSQAEDRPAPPFFPELTLSDGRTFAHAELKTFGATGVVVKHDNGLAQVPYSLLPENVRSKVAPQIAEAVAAAKALAAAKKPATETVDPLAEARAKAAPGDILLRGRCFVASGNQPRPVAQSEIRVYPASEFSKVVDQIEKQVNPRWMAIEENRKQAESRRDQTAVAEAVKEQKALTFSKWDQLPAPAAAAKTDAEGRFTLNHHVKGEYLIFARSAVKMGADAQHFVWIISSRTIADPSRVVLTNDNAL